MVRMRLHDARQVAAVVIARSQSFHVCCQNAACSGFLASSRYAQLFRILAFVLPVFWLGRVVKYDIIYVHCAPRQNKMHGEIYLAMEIMAHEAMIGSPS